MAYTLDPKKIEAQRKLDALERKKALSDPLGEFEQAIRAYGLLPDKIDISGSQKIIRVKTSEDKGSNKSGWYWIEEESGVYYGTYGDWRIGESVNWKSSNMQTLSPDELRKVTDRMRIKRETNQKLRQEIADNGAKRAVNLLNSLPQCTVDDQFKYFIDKDVIPYDGVKYDGTDVYIPVIINGEIRSVQRITPDNKKEFAYNTETTGGYFWIKGTSSTDIYFVEGYSTGATVHEATGANVMVCFNAHNLYNVVKEFRAHNKEQTVHIASDNDYKNEDKPCGNAGQIQAKKCQEQFANVKIYVPENIEGSDFNDMKAEVGIDAVKKILTGYQPRFELSFAGDLQITEQEWHISNFLPKVPLGLIYGASGTMKSFMVFDLALHMCAGLDWHGNKVKEEQSVLYICGEGFSSIAKRYKVWCKHKKIKKKLPFILTDKAVHMLDDEHRFDVVNDLTYFCARKRKNIFPSMIILDTLNRCFGAGDENSTSDMTQFIANVDELHHVTGATIMIVHHSGKNEAQNARGSSALKASLDFEYEVKMMNPEEFGAKIENAQIQLACTKMKDAEPPKNMVFEHQSIPIPNLFDDEGKPVTSVILEPMSGDKFNKEINELLGKKYGNNISKMNKSEMALLFVRDALIDASVEQAEVDRLDKVERFFALDRMAFNEEFRLLTKRQELERKTMNVLKSRSLHKLESINFIEPTALTSKTIMIKNDLVLNAITEKLLLKTN